MHNLFSIVKCRFIICLKANHKMAGLRVRARERLNQKCVSEQMFRFISFGLLCWWKNEYWLHAFLFLRRHVCQWNERKNTRKKRYGSMFSFLICLLQPMLLFTKRMYKFNRNGSMIFIRNRTIGISSEIRFRWNFRMGTIFNSLSVSCSCDAVK